MSCYTNTGCGNCNYGCCCRCRNKNKCYLCYNHSFKGSTCGWIGAYGKDKYPNHYICWDCKKTWKVSLVDRRSIETKKYQWDNAN